MICSIWRASNMKFIDDATCGTRFLADCKFSLSNIWLFVFLKEVLILWLLVKSWDPRSLHDFCPRMFQSLILNQVTDSWCWIPDTGSQIRSWDRSSLLKQDRGPRSKDARRQRCLDRKHYFSKDIDICVVIVTTRMIVTFLNIFVAKKGNKLKKSAK